MRRGTEVRLIHSPPLTGRVSSAGPDRLMLSMLIDGRYQLRGPFQPSELAEVTAEETHTWSGKYCTECGDSRTIGRHRRCPSA